MQNDLISRSVLVDMLLTENQRCITSTGHGMKIMEHAYFGEYVGMMKGKK